MLHCRQESGQHLLGGKGWGWHKQNLRHLQHVWCWNHSLVTYSWKVSKGLQKTNSRWPKEVLCSLHKDSGVKKRIIMCTLSWEVWRVGHLTLPLSRAGVFWGVCGKGCVCVCVCVCKNEAEMEDTRILGTVWKEMQNGVCSGSSYKDINPRDSWKALFPAEVFTRRSKIPQGIGTICITICCCLSRDPKDRIPLEKNPQFWVQPVVEESIGVQFVEEEEGVTPLQHYFAQEINKTLKLPLLPSICFSILVVGGVLFFFNFATGPHKHFSYSLLPLIFVCFAFIFGDPPNSKVSPFPFNFTILPFHPVQWSGLKHEKVSSPSCKLGKIILILSWR